MKRVSFDTSSNLFHSSGGVYLDTPDEARKCFGSREILFHAASAFVIGEAAVHQFLEPRAFCDFLCQADELISYNGRVWDLRVMENVLGYVAMTDICCKPHHDLMGWRTSSGLKKAVETVLAISPSVFEEVQSDRNQILSAEGKVDQFQASHLANTYRDAKFTALLWDRYSLSGDTHRTFYNGD